MATGNAIQSAQPAGSGTGTVTSVTATDTSIVVTGTAVAPTVATGTLDVIAADHPPAANWSNNSHKITSLANGSAAQDAAAFGQIPAALPPNGTAGGDLGSTYPNPTVTATHLASALPVAQGGTGLTAAGTDGQALITNSSGSVAWGGAVINWINAATTYGMSPAASASANVTAIQNAYNAAVTAGGGMIYVPGPGTYQLNSTVTKDLNGTRVGLWLDAGVTLAYYGSGDMLRLTDSSTYTTRTFGMSAGIFGAGILDGTNITAAATGLHIGDIFQAGIYVSANNWNAFAGSVGIHFDNTNFWTEQLYGRIFASSCRSHVVFDNSTVGATASTGSFDRADLDIFIDQNNAAWNGVVFQNGTYIQDIVHLGIYGNFANAASTAAAVLTLTGSAGAGRPDTGTFSALLQGRLDIGVESDGAGTVGPFTILFGAAGNTIFDCYGGMDFLAAPTAFQGSNVAPNQMIYAGFISGDGNLQSTYVMNTIQASTIDLFGTVDVAALTSDPAGNLLNGSGVVPAEQIQVLSGTRTFANNTSAQAIFNATTNGALTVVASTTYEFECLLNASGFSASSHTINFGLTGLTGSAATFTSVNYLATMATTAGGAASIIDEQVATAAAITSAGTGQILNGIIRGIMRINAGGTITPALTQVTNSAAAVVQANSFFRCWPIGSNTVTNVGNWS